MLISRVANADLTLYRDVATQARISPHADLTLDDQSARRAIQHLNFIQMKRKDRAIVPPGPWRACHFVSSSSSSRCF